MDRPVTTLYKRFSNPGSWVTEWDDTLRVIEAAELFWVTTVRADGRPHVTPLVAVWLDGALHFCTGVNQQKALNVRDNAHVSLTTGRNSWDRGVDVVLEGEAVRVSDNDALQRIADVWTKKWDGRWRYEVRDGYFDNEGTEPVIVFAVKPTRVLAFAKGDFKVTLYSF
jgi:nitroimidazol reductase NimA-like FMN-containing flavoprotein (pyridoxamine 5'-phosphate oxidase superfamily)